MSIGFLGPKGSYSYEAALKYKNENEEIVEFSTISKVIENLEVLYHWKMQSMEVF